jgi:sterol desaturase/sphingolipid hydroxylase (fatty acid hydroxylase superfamily)
MTFTDREFQIARAVVPGLALALGLALERLTPHARLRPAWGANLGLWLAGVAAVSLVCGACSFAAARFAEARGLGLFAALAAPAWLGALLSIPALDLVSYLWHRANHALPFLWRFHRVHHADPALHVTSALRFHPGELLLSLPIRAGAVVLLGAPPFGVALFELVFAAANVLEHGNFDLPAWLERALGRAVITPALHRLHHSRLRREHDSNFGTIFSLWDRVGRSFGASTSAARFATGEPGLGARDPVSFAAMLAAPFAAQHSE